MEATAPAPAPAEAVVPVPTVSASMDAASKGDFSAFKAAERAARDGRPLERVEKAAEPPTATAPESAEQRQISNRQAKTNDAIRTAVETATTDLRRQIEDLHRQLQSRTPPQEPRQPEPPKEAPKPERFKTLAEYSAEHPEATLEDYMDARDSWRDERTARTTREHGEMAARAQAEHQRIDAFLGQMKEAQADPAFVAAVTPEVKARFSELKPFGALQPGETAGPKNFIAEQVYDSPMVKSVLLHFAQHPEEIDRLAAGPAQLAQVPPSQRTEAHATFHLRWIEHEFKRLEGRLAGQSPSSSSPAAAAPARTAAPVPDTVSSAPPPPPTLSKAASATDPQAAAFARGDFAEWNRIEKAKSRERGHL